jgi:hydrogenase maturation protease
MDRNGLSQRFIGIGSLERGDDAIGRLIARRLKARGLPGVVELDGEVAALLESFDGAEAVYIADAASFGAEPGTLRRFDAAEGELPAGLASFSTHGLGLAQGIELARALKRLPPRCLIYAVEGRCFEIGAPLSPEVEAAAAEVERRILFDMGEAA